MHLGRLKILSFETLYSTFASASSMGDFATLLVLFVAKILIKIILIFLITEDIHKIQLIIGFDGFFPSTYLANALKNKYL
jgi:hypothetical protein